MILMQNSEVCGVSYTPYFLVINGKTDTGAEPPSFALVSSVTVHSICNSENIDIGFVKDNGTSNFKSMFGFLFS